MFERLGGALRREIIFFIAAFACFYWFFHVFYNQTVVWPASNASKYCLRASPPAYPVSCPWLPITRWQGTRMAILFCPWAWATARTARGWPRYAACWA